MFVIMLGSPLLGLTFIGPFDWAEDAIEYAESELRNSPWEVVPLDPPINFDEPGS